MAYFAPFYIIEYEMVKKKKKTAKVQYWFQAECLYLYKLPVNELN